MHSTKDGAPSSIYADQLVPLLRHLRRYVDPSTSLRDSDDAIKRLQVGSFPTATLQYNSTTLYQVPDHIR